MTIERCGGSARGSLPGLLVLMLAAGCSRAPEKTYPVEGRVTLDGKPLKGGTVLFESIQPGTSGKCYTARGTIDSQGRYRLSTFTFGDYDGAVPGRHRAMILPDLSQVPDRPGARPPVDVPDKYQSPETTDLEYEVKPGQENRIDVELYSEDAVQ